MAFIDEVLQAPSYGWKDEKGELIKPTRKQLFREFFSRSNIFKSKKNWISLIGWFMIVCMIPFAYFFFGASYFLDIIDRFSFIYHDHYGYAWHYLVPSLLYT